MSDSSAPVVQLARSWNLQGNFENLTAVDGMTACRRKHTLPEFPDITLPSNAVVLVNRNARSWRIGGGRNELASAQRGEIGLVAEGSYGRWEFSGRVDVFHFYLSNAALGQMAAAEDMRRFTGLREELRLDDPVIRTLAGEAAQACMEGEEGKLYASTLGLAMGLRLIRAHSNLSASTKAPPSGGLVPWQKERVIAAMRSQLKDDPSLAELAALIGLSPYHFARAFKAATGLPPHRYLIELRIQRARELLEKTDFPVAEIAAMVGYEDPSHLARLFRQHAGASPAAYRRDRRS